MAGIFQAHVFPGFSAVERFVYTIAIPDAALGVILAGTYPYDVRVGRVEFDNTDGK